MPLYSQYPIPGAGLATSAITLGYAQITAGATVTSSLAAVTGLSVTVTIPTGGRRVRITFGPGAVTNGSTAVSDTTITIWDGTVGSGTQIGYNKATAEGISHAISVPCSAIVTPAAGSKTYNIGAQASTAGGSTIVGAATQPAYILVEAI